MSHFRHATAALGLLLTVQAAGPASAYEIGHLPLNFSLPSCGAAAVGAEVYYPADVAGEGVPAALPPAGGFPVVAFGHGYQMVVQAYPNLWEALVPAGYVVALPITGGQLFPSHGDFGRDLACTIEKLRLEGDDPASLFAGVIGERAAVAGHSMGGGASFLAAAGDPSIDAVAVLAPAETNPSAVDAAAQVQVPLLVIGGSYDCVAPEASHATPMYQASASSCRTRVSITGASHCQFAINNLICNLGQIFCASPLISRSEQHQLVNGLLLPWLDAVLRNAPVAWRDFGDALESAALTHEQDCPVVPGPDCSDGLDNDADGFVDYDGAGVGAADPECMGNPARKRERKRRCGLGFELGFLVAALAAGRRFHRAQHR